MGLAAATGGAVGACLLLLTPAGVFAVVVPAPIGSASVLVLLAPAPVELAQLTALSAGPGLTAGIFGVGVYGGYFGAAAGVMMLAMLLMATAETTVRASAAKNAWLGVANGVALEASTVQWTASSPGSGCCWGSL